MNTGKRIIEYFREKNSSISKINKEIDPSSQFCRLLYITLLDGLSRIVFPMRSGNRDRFCTFVREFGQWDDGDRVSITHLSRYLLLNPEPKLERLREYSGGIINKWAQGELPIITNDPTIEQIREMWPKEIKYSDEWKDIKLETFQHINLLYELRNSLVHEFQVIGNTGFDDFKTIPYYMHVTTLISLEPEQTLDTWDLFYPLSFLSDLANKSIDNLDKYLQRNNFDYSLIINSGSYWIQRLNT